METYPELLDANQNNPFSLSMKYLLVVTFNKSNSKNFQTALLWAKSAEVFKEFKMGKDEIYLCAFGKNVEQAGAANVFLHYVENWSGKQIYIGGRIHFGSIYNLSGILDCYQKSLSCQNVKSYCCFLSDDVFLSHQPQSTSFTISLSLEKIEKKDSEKKPLYVVPCQNLQYRKIEKDTCLGSWSEQIQALAVRENLAWCPSFNAALFRQYD